MSKLKKEFISAYLQLLQHTPPKDITVKQIVKEANASRSTFYTYFESKEQLQEQVKQLVQHQFMMHYSEGESLDGFKTTLALCQHMLKYRAFYRFVFQDANEIQFMSEELTTRLIEVYNDKDYAIFASYGTIGYLKNWVEEGFVISPAEAAEKLLKIGFTDWTYDIRNRALNLTTK